MAFKKIVAFEGDLTLPNLGLKSEDKKVQVLIENVSVVFNGAASLRLEAGLKDAINSNTLGTQKILELCREMKQLKAFVHLSTAFCHCEYEVLEEQVYPSPANPEDVIRAVQWMDEQCLDVIQTKVLGPHPNSYTYSKRLAESLVEQYNKYFPVAIARPSIVLPALHEPIPGWVDSLNGPVGVVVAAGKGVIRSMLCGENNYAEVVPVDIAINALIAIAWRRGVTKHDVDDQVPCYNISCNDIERVTWGEVLKKGKQFAYEYPFDAGLWYPNGTIRTNRLTHFIVVFFLQIIPAYLIDFLMLITRNKRFMVRVQNRISVGMEVLQYFTMRSWDFKNKNVKQLTELMNERDKKLFEITNADYDIDTYFKDFLLGARQFCMKEPLSSLPRARVNLKRMYYLNVITQIVLGLLGMWLLVRWLDTIRVMLDYSGQTMLRLPVLNMLVPKT
nr:PREDICTED: putative fatty acyl-CoA reductase CG5065 [Bemisia tabaci]